MEEVFCNKKKWKITGGGGEFPFLTRRLRRGVVARRSSEAVPATHDRSIYEGAGEGVSSCLFCFLQLLLNVSEHSFPWIFSLCSPYSPNAFFVL